MQILNVAQTYFPYLAEGGRPVKVRILSRELARRGHGVTVLTANLGSQEWFATRPGAENTSLGWRTLEDGVEAVYLPSWLRYRTITLNPHVIRFCGASLNRFHVAHFYGLYDLLGPSASYFCRRRGLPYVIEPMGMFRPIDRSFRFKRLWHRTVGRAFWRNAALIIATSEMEREELVEDGVPSEKMVIRYNGIDPGVLAELPPRGGFRAKWGVAPDEPLILFLSRLIPRKGADVLIEAFAAACPQFGRLVIAGPEGEPGYRAHLEKCAYDAGVEGRVMFTGPLYDREKLLVLADADVFVLPSRYENFANAPVEAMACGVPVIITQFCGIRSLVDGRAGLVVSPEKEPLSEALGKLINDSALRARLKEGCREVTNQLSWDRLAKQMEGYYAEALARSHGVH